MSKRKSIVLLSILLILIVFFGVFAFTSVEVGLYDYNAPISTIPLGIDLKGGVYVVFEASIPLDDEGEPLYAESELETNIAGTMDILQERLFAAGYTEATVTTSGTNQIRVEISEGTGAAIDVDEVFDIIGKPAVLEFRDPNGNVILSGQKGHIKTATAGYNSQDSEYGVYLTLSNEGKKLFATATTEFVGKAIGIYLDGEMISNPTVNSAITDGKPVITGNFTAETATELAIQIQGGSLQVNLEILEQNTISPTLGENAVTTGLIAAAIGILLVFVFMAVVYRGLGLIADLALLVYSIIVIYLMGTLSFVQLSLPGIAGLILGVGMAVDGNIIIFERIKEEYKTGKNITASVKSGFKRALSSIFDGNITTLLAAIVLWVLGTTAIQGFAMTLVFSIVVSLISSLLVTRLFCEIFLGFNRTDAKFYNLKRDAKEGK